MGISTTFLTSVLSLLAMVTADFLVVFTIFKNNFRSSEDISFANCWMAVGIIHLFMALRTAFFGMGMVDFDRALAYIVQILIVFVLATVGYHIISTTFKSNIFRYFFYFLVFVVIILFLCFFINFGLSGPMVSEWGTEYTAAWQANSVLGVGFVLAFLTLAYSLLKAVKSYKKTGDAKKIITTLSLMLYIFFSVFEQAGNIGWQVLFIRVLILISILIAYSAYELERYKVQ